MHVELRMFPGTKVLQWRADPLGLRGREWGNAPPKGEGQIKNNRKGEAPKDKIAVFKSVQTLDLDRRVGWIGVRK